MAIVKNRSTPKGKEFWDHIDAVMERKDDMGMSEIRVPEDRVQRYDAVLATDVCGNKDVVMRERVDGLFVRHEDYARVEAERDEALKQQHTICAKCLVDKHTPLRRDEMGGYVCLTCIDAELDNLTEQTKVLREALELANEYCIFNPVEVGDKIRAALNSGERPK